MYVNAIDDHGYLTQSYADRLGNVKIGAASIGFTALRSLNLDTLEELLAAAHRITPPDAW